ncbi:class I SAM-dependent methyltransferase [Candidatus Poribacteria bacterium]|nr:class I SAM-dependent methyltransferase [Candidatus Poribacteria bacterium]
MPVFEIRDKSIDEAELNRKIEENLKERQSDSLAALAAAPGAHSGLAPSVQDIEIRDGLGFLRKLARELPDYKVFGPFKTLRRFVKRQIAIDKAIVYFMHTVTNRLSFLADRLDSLDKRASTPRDTASEIDVPKAGGSVTSPTDPSAPRMRLDALAESPGEPAPAEAARRDTMREDQAHKDLLDYFHFKFNCVHGGTEKEIREKGLAYIEFLRNAGTVLDIGCGRGSFLELLRENGIHAVGIDSNRHMVDVCSRKALDVTCVDASDYLGQQDNNRFGGIFASHVIEHFQGDDLVRFVRLCYDKLAPGGCVILETPNPLSIFVLGGTFYLDVTHVRPVHPDFLKLLLDTIGFKDIRTLPVSPFPEEEKFQLLKGKDKLVQTLNANLEKMNKMFYSHYNYAVIALK